MKRHILGLAGTIGLFVREAAAANQYGGVLTNPLEGSCGSVSACADKIITLLQEIAVPILAIMVLYGGFQMMTAGGDPEKFKSGRSTLLYAAIGFVIVLAATGVKDLIVQIFS